MYNDTIKAENKIITNEDLFEIFQLMGETLKKYQKISKVEEQRNAMLDYSYQEYSFTIFSTAVLQKLKNSFTSFIV